jgi:hypothetical protein
MVDPMGSTLGAIVVTTVVLIVVARFLLALWTWPTLSARVWPWLRLRPWWPVPAERVAEALLHQTLSPTEYRQLCYTGFLEVPSPSRPNRTYRVPRGPGQVLVLENNRVTERLCVQPAAGGLPEADVVLMHKLLIEADEDTYLQTANHFPRSVWH